MPDHPRERPRIRPEKDAYCTSCGARYGPDPGWPRPCTTCGAKAYRNPLPVAVALLPVQDGADTGLVVITRTIEPARGRLALPGGFIDHDEDWRHAVARELSEETGIQAHQDEVRLADALSSPDGHLLLFGLLPPRPLETLPASTPTAETEGWQILHSPRELGFPLHTIAVRRWFSGEYARVQR